MAKKLRIALAQLNLIVGDIPGNLQKLIQAAITARDESQADIIVFPELSITGYPPEDLLLRKSFLQASNKALYEFIAQVQNIYCVISHPHATSQGLYNSCSVVYNGTILERYAKQQLPNYGVFDECRYFTPGNSPCVIPINGIPVGIIICEDLWTPHAVQQAATQGARIILCPNASPFETDKYQRRLDVLSKRAKSDNIPIVYVNQVGGQDDLVFDGGSMVVDATGNLCQHAGFFQENILTVDIEFSSASAIIPVADLSAINISEEQKVYECLVLGVRDYIHKNNFKGALIGVSGGMDSALTLAIAVDALGKENVHAVVMPSRYTADISLEDGMALIKNLDVSYENISIEPIFESFLKSLSLHEKKPDVTTENLQSRCRGTILMALSNKTGKIVLITGNRSEMAVGYATLYGDMAGGFAVLKDIPKTFVYRLAHYRNQVSPVIPQRVFDRPPTAELAPDQKDEDTLPPYPILDKILDAYINQELGVEEIVALGCPRDVVVKVIGMIKKNEYKRRQAPVGVRINHKAFGRDRRYSIVSGFNEG